MSVKDLKVRVTELEAQLEAAKVESAGFKKSWIETQIEKSKGMGDTLERGILEKRLRIIDHITAGRGNEAIQELVTPLPISFAMKVVFADDETRIASETEMFNRLKKMFLSAIESTTVKREEKTAADSAA